MAAYALEKAAVIHIYRKSCVRQLFLQQTLLRLAFTLNLIINLQLIAKQVYPIKMGKKREP